MVLLIDTNVVMSIPESAQNSISHDAPLPTNLDTLDYSLIFSISIGTSYLLAC